MMQANKRLTAFIDFAIIITVQSTFDISTFDPTAILLEQVEE
jgi:hypothetical protein